MFKNYLYNYGSLSFIVNAQASEIGLVYPRVFVRFPDNSCLNYDLTLGTCFEMSEKSWDNWLDGTEYEVETVAEMREIAQVLGFDWNEFSLMVLKNLMEVILDISDNA